MHADKTVTVLESLADALSSFAEFGWFGFWPPDTSARHLFGRQLYRREIRPATVVFDGCRRS
jgi:hypothetical protein